MQQPERTPPKAGRPGRGTNGLKHSEDVLSIKETASLQDNPLIVPVTIAGAYLCRRFHINPVIADLIASLAGLGPDRRAA
jgi:hypothetical protein